MKTRFWIIVGGVILQLAVAATRFLPIVSDWWQKQSSASLLYPVGTILSIHFALLSATVTLMLLTDSSAREKWQDTLLAKMTGAHIKPLSDRQFYPEFEARVKAARHSVSICYFAPYPPSAINNPDRVTYYESILQQMRKRDDLRFRRIIRDSPENRIWAATLLQELEKCANVELAILSDLPPEHENPLAMSVQLIDEDCVVLVALGGHDREGPFRDLLIVHEAAGAALNRYYSRLWAKSKVLLSSGRLTPEGQQLIAKRDKSTP
jgi:hypothetical protein